MSKPEKEKVIVAYGDDPVLEDLDLPGLLKEYKAVASKESFHQEKVAYYSAKRSGIRGSLQTVIQAVHADTVLYTDSMGGEWRSTLIQPETTPSLDPELLKTNLAKIGKLAAPIIAAIFEKSTLPGKPKASYVKVTAPDSK